ncbi:hypothetical protein PG987_014485 [Apiospora arundinis]
MGANSVRPPSIFFAHMALDEMPGLTSVVVDLPKPHPRYETPERHFTPGSAIFASEWKKKALTDAASRL